jgi:hypothetical protein
MTADIRWHDHGAVVGFVHARDGVQVVLQARLVGLIGAANALIMGRSRS